MTITVGVVRRVAMRRETPSDDREDETRSLNRRTFLRGVTAGSATGVGSVAGRSTTAQAERCRYRGSSGPIGVLISGGRGVFGRLLGNAADRSPRESAVETARVYNENSDVLLRYVEARMGDRRRASFDTIRVRFTGRGNEDVVRYVVSDVDSSRNAFTDTRIVEDVDRPVEGWVRLEGLATAAAPEELQRFVDCYAADGRPVPRRYLSYLLGLYGPDVRTSLFRIR